MLACVSRFDLTRYLDGRISLAEEEAIHLHIDQCANCQETLRDLQSKDTLVEQLRDLPQPDAYEQEHGLQSSLLAVHQRMEAEHASPWRLDGEIPKQLGPYTIHERLASGGMGAVFRATHTHLKRMVALKILPADRWLDSVAVERFQREMEAIGRLNHPHIIRATDAGAVDGLHYLVMDYVRGVHWGRLAKVAGPLPGPETAELVRQAALGLEYVHEHGLIHRDMKPSNLMLAWQDEFGDFPKRQRAVTKILDLGLARLTPEPLPDERELTTIGQLMGTLDYMSPEQAWDSHNVDARSDIYGLGATAFKLLVGHSPYGGPGYENLLRKIRAMVTQPPPRLSDLRPDLPVDFASAIDRMLAVDPQERYASAAAVAAAMQPFAKDADLDRLLRQAESAAAQDLEPPSQSYLPVNLFRARVEDAPLVPKTVRDFTRFWVIVATLLASAGLLAVIYLITDYGELVVRTPDPNVVVAIKRSDRVVKEWQLDQGENSTRIRSGEYLIELSDARGDLRLDPTRIVISRGEQELVTVERKETKVAAGEPPVPPTVSPANETPTFKHYTSDEWLSLLEPGMNNNDLSAVSSVLAEVSAKADEDQTAAVIVTAMRQYGSLIVDANVTRGYLIENCLRIVWTLSPSTLEKMILGELGSGNSRSRDFLVVMLGYLDSDLYHQLDSYNRHEIELKAKELKPRIRKLFPRIVEGALLNTNGTSSKIEASVARLLAKLIRFAEIEEPSARSATKSILESGDPHAIVTLSSMWGNESTEERVAALLHVAEVGDVFQRDAALARLKFFPQPLPRFALPRLLALLQNRSVFHRLWQPNAAWNAGDLDYQACMSIMHLLSHYGSDAKEAVEFLKSRNLMSLHAALQFYVDRILGKAPTKGTDEASGEAEELRDAPVILPGSRIKVRVSGTLPSAPIDGDFLVEPTGHVPLGPEYGRVLVAGMTFEQAEQAIALQLSEILRQPRVLVTLPDEPRPYPAESSVPPMGPESTEPQPQPTEHPAP